MLLTWQSLVIQRYEPLLTLLHVHFSDRDRVVFSFRARERCQAATIARVTLTVMISTGGPTNVTIKNNKLPLRKSPERTR